MHCEEVLWHRIQHQARNEKSCSSHPPRCKQARVQTRNSDMPAAYTARPCRILLEVTTLVCSESRCSLTWKPQQHVTGSFSVGDDRHAMELRILSSAPALHHCAVQAAAGPRGLTPAWVHAGAWTLECVLTFGLMIIVMMATDTGRSRVASHVPVRSPPLPLRCPPGKLLLLLCHHAAPV